MSNDIEQSFQYLKDTVPLLIKHKIAAVPTNYALWYTYVAKESEPLNKELDSALDNGVLPSAAKSEELYRQHLADKQEVNVWDLRQTMQAMLLELNQSMRDTHSDTSEFKTVIDKSLDEFSRVEKEGLSLDEVMALVRTMVKEIQSVRQSTISFNGSLINAQKEIEQLKLRLAESEKAALYDALTGLCNRGYFDSEIDSKMGMQTLSLLMIDIDHFKKINDTHGHLMGDLVIKAVAKKLQNGCRDQAQVFRYGGEEFAVLLPGAKLSSARQIAETLRRAVEKISVKDRRSGVALGNITVSVGVAQAEPGENSTKLISRADKLLYKAKQLGRNRVMPISS